MQVRFLNYTRKVSMSEQEYHEMVLDTVLPSGAEEWYCPTCGRRFLMQWPPAYSKVILEPGDESAIHSGGKGGVTMQGMKVDDIEQTLPIEEETALLPEVDESTLQPYLEWLEKVDFERMWKSEADL
jgi:hypothetical protein